ITWTADGVDLGTFDLDTLTVFNFGGDFSLGISAVSGGNPVSQVASIASGSGRTHIDINPAVFNDISSFTITITNLNGASTQNIDLESMSMLDLKAPSANAAPTDIALSNSSVNQSGGANATVGTLSTTDADGSDAHTYTLVSGTGDT